MSDITKFSEKQKKSFDRSLDRAVHKVSNGEGGELPLFIRVAQSRIYNGKPVFKALLKEVIYMRAVGLHNDDLRLPKGTPWSGDYRKYEGWCWARQEYLANRVGCVRESANRALKQIVKEGYLKTRKWMDRSGRWHKQYFPDEAFIDAKIAELGAELDESTDKIVPTSSTPCDLMSHSQVTYDHMPSDVKSHSGVTLKPNPRDLKSQQGVGFSSSLEVGVSSTTFISTPPAASPSGDEKSFPASQGESKTKTTSKTKATPTEPEVGKAEEKDKTQDNPDRYKGCICMASWDGNDDHIGNCPLAKDKAAVVGFDPEEA